MASTLLDPSVGYADVNACWTPEQLKVKPGERAIRRQNPPDFANIQHDNNAPDVRATTPRHLKGVIRRVTLPANKKLIALTLDFCEQSHEIAGYDGAIIDDLRQKGVPATLFMGGKWMRTHQERTRQLIADPLFELANHSEFHRNVRGLSDRKLFDEIFKPNPTYSHLRRDLLQRACYRGENNHQPAQHLRYFRFPYGACNARALKAVNDAGLIAIQWDFSSWDSSRAQTGPKIARRMLREVRPGSIILAHANGRGHHTAHALRIAIPKLRARGFEFVTVSELLAAGTPVIKQRCYNVRPGDTDRYDRYKPRRSKKSAPRGPSILP